MFSWCQHLCQAVIIIIVSCIDVNTEIYTQIHYIINLSYCRIQMFTVVWFVLSTGMHPPSYHLLVLKRHVCDLDFSSSKNSALQDVMIQNLEILHRNMTGDHRIDCALLVLHPTIGIPEDPRLSSLGRSDTRHRRRRNFSFQATLWRMGGCSTSSSWRTWWCGRSDDGGYGMIF